MGINFEEFGTLFFQGGAQNYNFAIYIFGLKVSKGQGLKIKIATREIGF